MLVWAMLGACLNDLFDVEGGANEVTKRTIRAAKITETRVSTTTREYCAGGRLIDFTNYLETFVSQSPSLCHNDRSIFFWLQCAFRDSWKITKPTLFRAFDS